MRKNNLKKKKRNIFEVLGIKQDNKKWLVLILTIVITGYLLFSLIYAPISCISNIKANADTIEMDEGKYRNIYTTDANGNFVIELPTIYSMGYAGTPYTSTNIKYIMTTNQEILAIEQPWQSYGYYNEYTLASNYVEQTEPTIVDIIQITTITPNQLTTDRTTTIGYALARKQVGTINLTEIRYFNIIQDVSNTIKTAGFKIIKDENNYIEYWFTNGSTYKAYWDIVNREQNFEINIGLFSYDNTTSVTGAIAKDYWQQYFTNNETFKDTYKDYWYEYYYQSIYNQGLEAGQTYSETTFYTLIDAVTFGAIKPIYSILNFEVLGVNLWNLATSIFTILIIVIIIKFIGMVV